MNVLVTGASGFVGSHAAATLIQAGHRVRLLARDPRKAASALEPFGVPAADVVRGDMTDASAVVEALDGCDAVVHCAAEIGVAGGSAPRGTATVEGARLVIGGAAQRGLDPIVYTSSITVHLPSAAGVVTPDSPLVEPLSAYAAQKCEVERFVQRLQAAGAPVTTLVLGSVYGPRSPHLDGSFTALLAALAAGGMYAPESGMGVVDVRDVAAVVARALRPGRGPRRYLVSGHWVTWRRWAELLAEASGRPVPFHAVTEGDLIALGRQFDRLRAAGEEVPPLSEEAAVVMSAGCPGDDTATLAELGVRYRPTVETFRDAVDWLRDRDPAGGPASA